MLVCKFAFVVCEQYSGKSPRRISTKLGGGVRYGPRIMPFDDYIGMMTTSRSDIFFSYTTVR